jgi:hypothetical protein
MDGSTGGSGPDERGRFVIGQSGNPAGKTPGTRNRATALREALEEGEEVAVARLLINKALAGDAVTARFLFARPEPAPRGRAIALDLPAITPDEAVKIGRFLETRLKARQAVKLERRSPPMTIRIRSRAMVREARGATMKRRLERMALMTKR